MNKRQDKRLKFAHRHQNLFQVEYHRHQVHLRQQEVATALLLPLIPQLEIRFNTYLSKG